jgi:hypothetical protein
MTAQTWSAISVCFGGSALSTVRVVSESPPETMPRSAIAVDLIAVILAISDATPKILVVHSPSGEADDGPEGLPAGSLDPDADRTLDRGMRRWVRERTGIELGYLEQLYTFGDRDRARGGGERVLSIVYLALAREQPVEGPGGPQWRSCYEYFPWEDWRGGRPAVIDEHIAPALLAWAEEASGPEEGAARRERAELTFGLGATPFDPNRPLDRYELLYEAALLDEAAATEGGTGAGPTFGRPMHLDHRRIAATALERIRGKLSYRPLIFELLPETFTLLQLQRAVEALIGVRLHKSNFRRLIEQAQLVEGTGLREQRTGGRPAELHRFRREVLRERPAPGVVLPGRRR